MRKETEILLESVRLTVGEDVEKILRKNKTKLEKIMEKYKINKNILRKIKAKNLARLAAYGALYQLYDDVYIKPSEGVQSEENEITVIKDNTKENEKSIEEIAEENDEELEYYKVLTVLNICGNIIFIPIFLSKKLSKKFLKKILKILLSLNKSVVQMSDKNG